MGSLMQQFYKSLQFVKHRRYFQNISALCKLVQFKLSDIGEGIAEVQIREWFVKEGDRVAQFDAICEVQSDKASVTISSRYDGIIKKINFDINDIAKVGQSLLDIELDEEYFSSSSSESSSDEESETLSPVKESKHDINIHTESTFSKALATPAVRRIALEHKINLSDVSPTGKNGRVLKEDILRYIGHLPVIAKEQQTSTKFTSEIVSADRMEPVKGYMRTMIKTMSVANLIPHFGLSDEVIVDRLVSLRDQLKRRAEEKGVKMTYMPLFIKAASLSLKHFPILNSSLDENCENITYKTSHNICVAMDTPDGLVVPNIKNCEQRNIWEIAAELNRLQDAGLKGRFTKDDLSGGTFTLSNVGAIGGTYAKPIILPPQVAIGALGKMQVLPRFAGPNNFEVIPVHIVKVSWSADHRIIDGATMARFVNLFKQYLENPALMIAELK